MRCYDTYTMNKNIIVLILLLCLPATVQAQEAAQSIIRAQGLEITPFLLELEVEKGKTVQSEIDLTNRTASAIAINIQPTDFLPGSEGQPMFVPDTEINDVTFSLASWIKLTNDTRIVIQPNQTATFPFEVNPPANAEQGTHYGAILFSYSNASAENNVSEVTQSLGTILLVRYGQARESGVVDLQLPKNLFWGAENITLRNAFANTGNVHVRPKGEVYIKNMFGKIVSTPFINKDASNVLPKTERTFVNNWIPSSTAFGRYTLQSVITYGNSRLETREKVVIWILPIYLVVILLLILGLIIWFLFHGRHAYHRQIIKRHKDSNTN